MYRNVDWTRPTMVWIEKQGQEPTPRCHLRTMEDAGNTDISAAPKLYRTHERRMWDALRPGSTTYLWWLVGWRHRWCAYFPAYWRLGSLETVTCTFDPVLSLRSMCQFGSWEARRWCKFCFGNWSWRSTENVGQRAFQRRWMKIKSPDRKHVQAKALGIFL